MPQRALWAAALLGAALADAAGASQIAFYLMLGAVSAGGIVALAAIGDLVDARAERAPEARAAVRTLLTLLGLAMTVAGPAVRGPFVVEGTVPAVASSTLAAAVVLLALEAALAAAPPLRRPAPATRRRARARIHEDVELKRAA